MGDIAMKNKIKEIISDINIKISFEQAEQLDSYMTMLLAWNERMNLTAITEPEEVIVKHFADSISPLCFYDMKGKRVIDVGTGAGFPGIPLRIAEPQLELTLVDALQKRVGFLQSVCDELGLDDVECIHARAEELAADEDYREQFDIAVSRAVAGLNVLCEYDLPYVKVGGSLIALKGKLAMEELKQAENAISELGGEVAEVKDVKLPVCGIVHSLVEIRKVRNTDSKYPRRAKKIATKPL
jgi:16S rRNA (guanine527-N7)-methyltransferase